MNLQFISDSVGNTTGVFIPINEWNELKSRYKGIEQEEIDALDWHVDLVRSRINEFEKRSDQVIDFEQAMKDVEKDL